VAILGLLLSLHTVADKAPEIGQLSFMDRQYMDQQRTTLDDLARSRLGGQFNGRKDRDLVLLQTLLDRNVVRSDQKKELQG